MNGFRDTREVLSLIVGLLAEVDHDGRQRFSDQSLLDTMRQARRVADQMVALASVVTGEVSTRHAARTVTGTSLTSVISVEEQRSSGDASREVFASEDIGFSPNTRNKALSGEVSSRQAAVIGRALRRVDTKIPTGQREQLEQKLIAKASQVTPRQLDNYASEQISVLLRLKDTTVEKAEAQWQRAWQRRHLAYGDDGDGATWLKAVLPSVEAQPIVTAIEKIVAGQRREERSQRRARGTQNYSWQHRGDTVITDVKECQREDMGSQSHFMDESLMERRKRTPGQRNADAFLALITHNSGAVSTSSRPQVVVTVAEHELHDRAAKAGLIGLTGGLQGAAPLAPSELRRLCCDSEILPVVLGTRSEILDVGRTRRLVTPEIRRVLSLRDGSCQFPNCEKPDAACEAHHIIPWQEGGPTALDNLVLLCPYHHRIIEPDSRPEAERWRVTIDTDTRRPVLIPPESIQTGNSPPAA